MLSLMPQVVLAPTGDTQYLPLGGDHYYTPNL